MRAATEGVGLLLRNCWAQYFTIIASALTTRGAGAERFGLPSGPRGIAPAGTFAHCPYTGIQISTRTAIEGKIPKAQFVEEVEQHSHVNRTLQFADEQMIRLSGKKVIEQFTAVVNSPRKLAWQARRAIILARKGFVDAGIADDNDFP